MNDKKTNLTQQTNTPRKTPIALIVLFILSLAAYPFLIFVFLLAVAAAGNELDKTPCITAVIGIAELFTMMPVIPVSLGIELLFALTVVMNKLNVEKKKMQTIILIVMSIFTLISLIAFTVLWFRQLTRY